MRQTGKIRLIFVEFEDKINSETIRKTGHSFSLKERGNKISEFAIQPSKIVIRR